MQTNLKSLAYASFLSYTCGNFGVLDHLDGMTGKVGFLTRDSRTTSKVNLFISFLKILLEYVKIDFLEIKFHSANT